LKTTGGLRGRFRWWPELSADGWLLVATYSLRLFAYGFVSVVLALYLAALGLAPWAIGATFTAALAGGGVLTGVLGLGANRWGRRRMLMLSAALMTLAGALLAVSDQFPLLLVAAALGSVSPSGSEVGPFLSIEQAMLPQTTTDEQRTTAFSFYNAAGAGVGALGSAAAALPAVLGVEELTGYRALMWSYACVGLLLLLLFSWLSGRVEAPRTGALRAEPTVGVHRSRGAVARLAALFALDSLGSGFVVQGIVSYWFHLRYGIDLKGLGAIAFGTDVLAGLSFLAAPLVAKRLGLLKAAVLPHVVANVLVMLVPLMPTMELAVGAWLARYLFAQMERPPRQSFTMAIIDPAERAAAGGLLSVARNGAAAIAPAFAGATLAVPAAGLPFLCAGGVKLIYDGAIYWLFRGVRPRRRRTARRGGSKTMNLRILAATVSTLVLPAVLTGCVGRLGGRPRYTPGDQSRPAGAQQRWDFDTIADGELPDGVEVVSGSWGVQPQPDAPSPPRVLCQSANARWPVLLLSSDVYADLDLSVRFKPISGREDQAGGLVFRAQDGGTYFITRANALENNVRLYTMRNDNRTEIAGANRQVASGVWHELAVEVRGDHLRVRYDGEWVIDHQDSSYTAGRIGLWTKADSVTCFDNVVVTVPS
jgi:MFS family permease